MSKTYYVNIEPISYYFFGGERTFNTKLQSKYDNQVSNYYAISNEYPQQTAILGLMRYVCLTFADPALAKQNIIGDNFSIDRPRQTKGWIHSISPLVIRSLDGRNTQFLMPKPLIRQSDAFISIECHEGLKSQYNNKSETSISLSDAFDYKSFDTSVEWMSNDGIIRDVFAEPLIKSGVNIENNKGKKEDGYYMQKFQKLKKGFSFGVWVEFSDDIPSLGFDPIIMPFGADQGLFKLTFDPTVHNPFVNEKEVTNTIRLVSDAFVTHELYDYIYYGLTEEVDFRFIKSKASNFYKINNEQDKSDKYLMLKRGSVLYCKDPTKAASFLNNPIFNEIGYNHFMYI